MQKVNVQIDEIRHLSQFRSLPPRYIYQDVEYCIFKNDEVVDNGLISKSQHIAPYDLALRHKFNLGTPAIITDDVRDIVYLTRYTKDRQSLLMKEVLGGLDNYVHLEASTVDISSAGSPLFELPNHPFTTKVGDERYVIRHNTGARSLGFMVTPKISEFNARMFFRDIANIRNDKEKKTNAEYQRICKEYGVTFTPGVENREDEAADILNSGSFVITPYIDKPFKEYRVITSFGGELLIVSRDHNADPKQYAPICNEIANRMIFKNLSLNLTRLQPHGSFDLWISDTDTGWGIFEFQPQYGHEDIPDHVHIPFMKEVISQMVESNKSRDDLPKTLAV